MNRYMIEGLIKDLRAGKRIFVLSSTWRAASSNFHDVKPWITEDLQVTSIRQTVGLQSIGTSQGFIKFRSTKDSGAVMGGQSVDLLVSDSSVQGEAERDIQAWIDSIMDDRTVEVIR